mmetsp:Transcript_13168/g.33326  ORF Transcript_13168/g.33326 Transcript_13168/m.33326 type:complete len:308 (-) Transcript_13168:161-1084(-)
MLRVVAPPRPAAPAQPAQPFAPAVGRTAGVAGRRRRVVFLQRAGPFQPPAEVHRLALLHREGAQHADHHLHLRRRLRHAGVDGEGLPQRVLHRAAARRLRLAVGAAQRRLQRRGALQLRVPQAAQRVGGDCRRAQRREQRHARVPVQRAARPIGGHLLRERGRLPRQNLILRLQRRERLLRLAATLRLLALAGLRLPDEEEQPGAALGRHCQGQQPRLVHAAGLQPQPGLQLQLTAAQHRRLHQGAGQAQLQSDAAPVHPLRLHIHPEGREHRQAKHAAVAAVAPAGVAHLHVQLRAPFLLVRCCER